MFDTVIEQEQCYDDAASQALKCICGFFGNILLLYSIKSISDICKSIVDAELIYNLSSLTNCDNLHFLRYY